MRVSNLGFEPGPAGECGPRAEAFERSEELVFNLSAGSREIHQAGAWEAVQSPESCDREDSGCLPGEVCASGRGLPTGLVVEKNMTLPIVGPNAEYRFGKEQNGNFRLIDRGSSAVA